MNDFERLKAVLDQVREVCAGLEDAGNVGEAHYRLTELLDEHDRPELPDGWKWRGEDAECQEGVKCHLIRDEFAMISDEPVKHVGIPLAVIDALREMKRRNA